MADQRYQIPGVAGFRPSPKAPLEAPEALRKKPAEAEEFEFELKLAQADESARARDFNKIKRELTEGKFGEAEFLQKLQSYRDHAKFKDEQEYWDTQASTYRMTFVSDRVTRDVNQVQIDYYDGKLDFMEAYNKMIAASNELAMVGDVNGSSAMKLEAKTWLKAEQEALRREQEAAAREVSAGAKEAEAQQLVDWYNEQMTNLNDLLYGNFEEFVEAPVEEQEFTKEEDKEIHERYHERFKEVRE